MVGALWVGMGVGAPLVRAQEAPVPAATAPTLTPEALAALEALVASAPKAQRIVAHTLSNDAEQPERRDMLLTHDRQLATRTYLAEPMTKGATSGATSPAWLATPEQFTYIDDTFVRFPSKTGEGNRYLELPREEYWKRGDLPGVVRMAIHPLLPDVIAAMRARPEFAVTREPDGTWIARTASQEIAWSADARLRRISQLVQGRIASSWEFDSTDAGTLATIRERTPPAPDAPGATERVITWTVDEHTIGWADDDALPSALRFDPRAMGLVKWDTTTGTITDPDGKVVGVDKVPAVAAMDAFFTKKQQEETKKMRENPHGIPMAKWIWWLAGAALLCVVVDQVRRRL